MNHSRLLYLASKNPGKLREFSQAARAIGIDVQQLPGIDEIIPCIEDGVTFEENARKKALHYSATTKEMVFADDSGIIVDALGGAPGVRSARFAGPAASDVENNGKLIQDIARLPGVERTARYVCFIALAQEQKILTAVEGRIEGLIVDQPRGMGGFGYDPFFFFPALGKTFAELTPEEKFGVSHRGRAFRKLLSFLVPPAKQ
jgi:XTP/dITP diphosphohydrolase